MDRLATEAAKLYHVHKADEADEAFDHVLVALQKLAPSDQEQIAGWLEAWAGNQLKDENYVAVQRARRESLAIKVQLYGDSDWRVNDARLALEDVNHQSQLSPSQRRELSDAYARSQELSRLYAAGEYAEAARLAIDVTETLKLILGKQHPDYATSLNDLAALNFQVGDYAKAEGFYIEARDIQVSILGQSHPSYALTLNNLAVLYYQMGDFGKAEPLYTQAMNTWKQVLGEEHPRYAASLNNLAYLYYVTGDIAKAEPLYIEALDILKSVLGEEHPDYASCLNNLGLLYESKGDFAKAESHFSEARNIYEEVVGEQHPLYATSLNSLAGVYESMGDYARAEPLYIRAREIRKEVLGEEHPDYATSINNLAALYKSMSDYTQAESLYIEARDIRKRTLGEEHPEYAGSLSNLAGLYALMGAYARAEPLYIQAIDILRVVHGADHTLYATGLNNLAGLYESIGDFVQAESLYLQARSIFKNAHGESHRLFAISLNNLADLYTSIGDYASAEPLYLQARDIFEHALGKEHPDYAAAVGNLARLYEAMGHYARAEPLHILAREIRKKANGEQHPDYAASMSNLAALYYAMGDYSNAELLYCQARDIFKRAFGEKHPVYATSLNNLAGLYHAMGEFDKAEPLYIEAHAIAKNALGEEHPQCATNLNNLGGLYSTIGAYENAESFYKKAIQIQSKTLGEDHPEYAASLNNLALLYRSQRDYAQSESLFIESREIAMRALGDEHPDYAAYLGNLAGLYDLTGKYAEAESLVKQALQIVKLNLDNTSAVQSERQQLAMQLSLRTSLDHYISLGTRANLSGDAIYDQVHDWKGSVFVRQVSTRVIRDEPELAPLFAELQETSSRLAALMFSTPTLQKRAAYQSQIDALIEERERIEIELAQESSKFREVQAVTRQDIRDLQAALQDTTVLVDFFAYRHALLPKNGKGDLQYESRFVVFVIRSQGPIELIELGPAAPIERAVQRWRQSLGESEESQSAAWELKQLVWTPLKEFLATAESILISPDGVLAQFPFAVLPGDGPNRLLLEEHALSIVPVPQLLSVVDDPKTTDSPDGTEQPSLLTIGDVNFDGASGDVQVAQLATRGNSRSALRGKDSINFPPLPATAEEIDAVQKLFANSHESTKVTTLRGNAATEDALKKESPGALYVHIATHGFFATGELITSFVESDVVDTSLVSHTPLASPAPVSRERHLFHPALLSGLALAGANNVPHFSTDTAAALPDDGILTALEVAAMNLDGTELVVLSACETGLGQVVSGEGVLGLQRAFQMAGTRNTIVSLWKVDDEATSALMQLFYHKLWHEHKRPRVALRESQLLIYRNPELIGALGGDRAPDFGRTEKLIATALRNARAETTPPRYWAAFIVSNSIEEQ